NEVTVATYMDLSKAFDCVNHEVLLAKLGHYGVDSVSRNWIKSYLLDRSHLVCWNKQSSPICTLNIGVPQGSILGPLLFLIYINDIVNSSNRLSFVLFADDTTVYTTGKNFNECIAHMNNELVNISNWFMSNKLTLNVDKTQVMFFSRRKKPPPNTQVTLRGQQIVNVTKTKFLGVIVDEKLNWKEHIAYIASKVSKSNGVLFRIRNSLTIAAKNLLYHSLIHPYLTYCINVYASTYETNLRPLTLCQKRVIRTLAHACRHDHFLPLFCQWKILPFKQTINFSASVFVYKNVNHLSYSEGEFFTMNDQMYNLRNNVNLHLSLNRSTQAQLFLKYRAVKIWNSIPLEVRTSRTISNFKRKLKQYLFDQLHLELP
ncbi:RNA-directed DNA polymerase from mobile element jockey, partial [Cucumispora dikerogammari]